MESTFHNKTNLKQSKPIEKIDQEVVERFYRGEMRNRAKNTENSTHCKQQERPSSCNGNSKKKTNNLEKKQEMKNAIDVFIPLNRYWWFISNPIINRYFITYFWFYEKYSFKFRSLPIFFRLFRLVKICYWLIMQCIVCKPGISLSFIFLQMYLNCSHKNKTNLNVLIKLNSIAKHPYILISPLPLNICSTFVHNLYLLISFW